MNRLRMGVALLSCAALFSCGLFAPTDGTVLNHSYDSTAYQLFWQNPGKPVQLQCQADGAWVTFARADRYPDPRHRQSRAVRDQPQRGHSRGLLEGRSGWHGRGVYGDDSSSGLRLGPLAPGADLHAGGDPVPVQQQPACRRPRVAEFDQPQPDLLHRHDREDLRRAGRAAGVGDARRAITLRPERSDRAGERSGTDLGDFYVDNINLLTVDGLDFEHPASPYWARVPWVAFLVDAPNPAQALSFYRDLLTRNGVATNAPDMRDCSVVLADTIPSPPWVAVRGGAVCRQPAVASHSRRDRAACTSTASS